MQEISLGTIEVLEQQIKVQSTDGTWDYDSYMFGLLNGMLLAQSTLLGCDYKPFTAPKEWICDSKIKQTIGN